MRRILVTGGNKGIGFAICKQILARHPDTFVFVGSRDAGRGQAAVDRLTADHPDRAALLVIDVSSDASVEQAAKRLAAVAGSQPAPLYGLVNNAGIGQGDHSLKQVLEVNTLGVRRVCHAFLPLIDAGGGRIVNITSAAGPNFVSRCSSDRQAQFLDASIGWNGIQAIVDECLAIGPDTFADHGLGSGEAYGLSKALANTYTLVLARDNPTLRINACTPGFIETDLTRAYAERQGKTPAEMGMKSPEQGAQSALFLLFGEPQGNGRYYGSDAQRSPLDRYRAPGDPPYTGD
jgi:carbonyl reductase 1